MIARALARLAERDAVHDRSGGGDALEIHRDGDWFQLPGGPRVDLRSRVPAKRILAALAAHRVERPDAPLGRRELARAGWPAETIPPAKARNRVYVALHALRKAGLDDVLLTVEGGYLLDPAMPVRRIDA